MATTSVVNTVVPSPTSRRVSNASRSAVLQHAANELVFGVVGHVGSGTSTIAAVLEGILCSSSLSGGAYEAKTLSARGQIEAWAHQTNRPLPDTPRNDLQTTIAFQNLGDEMRLTLADNSAIAQALIKEIRQARAKSIGATIDDQTPVIPDGRRRAYILESLRHPEEVELLRHIYQDAFILIGVVCDFDKRVDRITAKYSNAGRDAAIDFMKRDAKGGQKHGQQVSNAFHLSDFFVNNSAERTKEDGSGNRHWRVTEHLTRLLTIISREEIVRPEISETAMHDAYSASLRSACLSRQVGAALVDVRGNIVSTGTNEVPKAAGGVYGESFGPHLDDDDGTNDQEHSDHRCAYRHLNGKSPFCSNTQEQNTIVHELISQIPELREAKPERKLALPSEIRNGRVGDLLEFSRAVHAEMDALLSASRTGATTLASRLFVTTYPCHYCARHIVSAGVDEVQYIEPYPKSLAERLHPDSITVDPAGWKPPSAGGSKVLFHPFVGVAPRMYRRAFIKDRELKDSLTGNISVGNPDWGTPWHLRSAAYPELELAVMKVKGPDA